MHDEMGGAGGWPLLELGPGERVAGFTLEGKIATGSFGTVFKASRDGRSFAVKLVRLGPRGEREVDALRRAQFPNVVSFLGYSLWPDDEPRFLVLALELVEGRPLDVWVREENPSALELLHRVLLPLAGTLADVHAAGVVHRDVKEANIIMREADGQPVLVDFGAAAYEGARRLTMQLPPGTPEYRSPEALRFARQWEGEPYPFGPGDDLWALGVVLYWLLTRELPFGDRHGPGLVRVILEETPVPPQALNPRVPPALSALCLRMLEKAPEARYADAVALEEALTDAEALADESWRLPLFPGGKVAKRPEQAPALAPVVHARAVRRWWPWAAGLGTAVVVGLLLMVFGRRAPVAEAPALKVASATQRTESTTHTPPQQAVPRQEIASPQTTGDVGLGAAPEASPTPALVAGATTRSEEPAMKKSQTTRSLLAAGCLAGSACAGGPQQRPPPEPAECPPGADATRERFGISIGDTQPTIFPAFEKTRIAVIREGEVTVEMIGTWGRLPHRTRFRGQAIFGAGRVYGRFTQALLPDGGIVPICLEWVSTSGLGWEMEPGSTAKEARIWWDPRVRSTPKFR
ncbi:serine/threonine protein kinase [Archangium lansingense]|uniref:Protein kinase n=1 Tax=Archangium lansingense TaxID=2995310 RepID=A0ABT3ZY57_9BACT|nr:serine/threonine protein kinase [Archangium lansinium]MCY1074335.1 protein kinase [Archangium lansinium]